MKRRRKTAADEEFARRVLENAQPLRELALENQRRYDESTKKTA